MKVEVAFPVFAEYEPMEERYINDTVARSATSSLTLEPPPIAYLHTAEARRLRALGMRLGLEWVGAAEHPSYWWRVPQGRSLTAAEYDMLEAAIGEAQEAEWQREAIDMARMRDEDRRDTRTPAERQAARIAEQAERVASQERGDRPARVSQGVWDAVPQELRSRVPLMAGGLYISDGDFYGEPDKAVIGAVEAIRRIDAIVAHVTTADPTADREHVGWLARSFWKRSTERAVDLVLQTLTTERAAEAERAVNVDADLRRRARLNDLHREFELDALVAAARAVLQRPGETDPGRALYVAAGELRVARRNPG